MRYEFRIVSFIYLLLSQILNRLNNFNIYPYNFSGATRVTQFHPIIRLKIYLDGNKFYMDSNDFLFFDLYKT